MSTPRVRIEPGSTEIQADVLLITPPAPQKKNHIKIVKAHTHTHTHTHNEKEGGVTEHFDCTAYFSPSCHLQLLIISTGIGVYTGISAECKTKKQKKTKKINIKKK